ncbi:hypothetical protein KGD83_20435 [Nocardiopsis akebiae]|uniref:Uncharacterized protein n=1 Tax=Nocardiopsis akebiae TaxID=2831968 RepID=A0ABX8CDT6_9ACTN|nr:hypothetical protein [Nocardiopsis akebiae]QUX32005.1 hypothetical protein KGD83_20435 [Nocardiopsis akebiae]
MGVSLHYSATRATPLDAHEHAPAAGALAGGERAPVEEAAALLPRWHAAGEVPETHGRREEVFGGLFPYDGRHLSEGEVLAGSGKPPHHSCGAEPLLCRLRHYLGALTRLRRAPPNARWSVRVEDAEVPWTGEGGYSLGGASA